MNKVLKILLLSDLLIIAGFGLLAPIFAIFLKDNIIGGSILAVGIAQTIFLFTKAITQIFISKYTDQEKGNVRELYTLVIGSLIFTIVPILYIFADNIWHIYIAQLINGLGAALAYPGWMTLFTRFTDRNKEGYEWSVYDTSVSLGAAATAAVGAYIAEMLGFNTLFIIVAIFSLLGTILLGSLFKQEIINNKK
ncbi:MFS transporter [Patescibacteria group bacterium]